MESSTPAITSPDALLQNPIFALGLFLIAICGIVSFICFIRVLVWLFNNNETNWAIVCLLLTVLGGGFGNIVAYCAGWLIPKGQQLRQTMTIWTGAIVGSLAGIGLIVYTVWPSVSR